MKKKVKHSVFLTAGAALSPTNDLAQEADIDDNQSSLSPAEATPRSNPQKCTSPSSPVAVPDPKRKRSGDSTDPHEPIGESNPKATEPTPNFSSTFISVAGQRPKASDYDDIGQALILRAAHDYEARVLTINAFPTTPLQDKWAQSCWRGALRVAKEDFAVTECIKRLVMYLTFPFSI